MNNPEPEISNNLYGFYDLLSSTCGIYSEKMDHWSVIKNLPGCWPRIIYKIDPEIVKPVPTILFSEKLRSGTYPEILIAGDQNIQQIDPFLRSRGFYPFSAWKGMAIANIEITPPTLPENIEVVKVESPTDLDQWIKVVTSQLIVPAHLEKTLLESLIAHPQFEAFLLKSNGLGVSTILVFASEHSTGLYLIATEKSAQRQGFAQLLVQQIVFAKTQQSTNPIVLHATPKGEGLYSKLGFLPYNQFFLYRFINMPL